MIEAFFIALLENVAEALRCNEGGFRTLPFNQGVGGKGGAVNEHADIARLDF